MSRLSHLAQTSQLWGQLVVVWIVLSGPTTSTARTLDSGGDSSELSEHGEGQGGELYSVEDRDLLGSHEIASSIGVLPMDSFFKGLTLRGSYTYYFSHFLGWELFGGLWSFNIHNDLKQKLNEDFKLEPIPLGELNWILDSSAVLRPFYGKMVTLNRYTLTGEMYFIGGYALGGYSAALPSGINAGMGLRAFMSQYFSAKFEIRDYLFFPGGFTVENNLYISFGIGLTFGFDPKIEEKAMED